MWNVYPGAFPQRHLSTMQGVWPPTLVLFPFYPAVSRFHGYGGVIVASLEREQEQDKNSMGVWGRIPANSIFRQ